MAAWDYPDLTGDEGVLYVVQRVSRVDALHPWRTTHVLFTDEADARLAYQTSLGHHQKLPDGFAMPVLFRYEIIFGEVLDLPAPGIEIEVAS